MSDAISLLVHVEQLEKGSSIDIEESLPASLFMGIEEPDLSFPGTMKLTGSAYVADSHAVIHFSLSGIARVRCTVCNELFTLPIEIKNAYITRDFEELEGGVYRYGDDLREEILLKIPSYAECQEEGCPQRTTVAPFLKLPSQMANEVYYPFKDLS